MTHCPAEASCVERDAPAGNCSRSVPTVKSVITSCGALPPLPAAKTKTSAPAPPVIRSVPVPPEMVSSPPRPLTVSFPPSALIVSALFVPNSVLPLSVPLMVAIARTSSLKMPRKRP